MKYLLGFAITNKWIGLGKEWYRESRERLADGDGREGRERERKGEAGGVTSAFSPHQS
jgi:hypothetical protein